METLTHTFAIKVLIILLAEKKRMTIREVAEKLGESHGTIVHAIDALLKSDLIESRQRKDAPYEGEVVLTPVGRTVATKLKEIEEIIGWIGKSGIS